jgi:hypothetical protein
MDAEDEKYLNDRELSILDQANSLIKAGRLKWSVSKMELYGVARPKSSLTGSSQVGSMGVSQLEPQPSRVPLSEFTDAALGTPW